MFKHHHAENNSYVELDLIERECDVRCLEDSVYKPYIMRHLCKGVRFFDDYDDDGTPGPLGGLTLREGVWEELETEFNKDATNAEENKEADKEETKTDEEKGEEEDDEDEDDEEDEDEEKQEEDNPPKKKVKRGPGIEAKPMFNGSHAKVLAYYKELGNFEVKVDDEADAMLIHPRLATKSGKVAKPRTFRSRFGKHFRKVGFFDAREFSGGIFAEDGVAYVLPNLSRRPIDSETFESPRDRKAEDAALLETDVFA